MNNLTFAQLCAEYAAAHEEIQRLSGISPAYRSEEHYYILEHQKSHRAAVRAELQRRLEAAK